MNLSRLIRNSVKTAAAAVIQHARVEWFAHILPPYPNVLNLVANEVCNSRCPMCWVWQQKPRAEISQDELNTILNDRLFQRIERVIFSGGEPTLRSDLPEIGALLCSTLPRLKTVHLVTNALATRQVISRAVALAQEMMRASVELKVIVSLDGIEDDHDRNRGVNGNFESAVTVIEAMKRAEIPLGVHCTLTHLNCDGADDLLIWCDQNRISDWSFGVAVESPQFHNVGYLHEHEFSEAQRFHVLMFFEQLIHKRKLLLVRRQYYKKLVSWLARGGDSQPCCVHPQNCVALNMQGHISACPSQVNLWGSAVEESARKLFLQQVKSSQCRKCLPDAQDLLIPRDMANRAREVAKVLYQNRRKPIDTRKIASRSIQPASRAHPSSWRHVLITGWYGTETAGDKAILGEVLHFLKTYAPGCRITVTTLNRNISEQSQRELSDLRAADLVDMPAAHHAALIEQVDAVLIGGGPLMESQARVHIWRIFAEANRQRKARVVFGCGVGPIHSDFVRRLTTSILHMTTAGFLRDRESYDYASQLVPGNTFEIACDPAFAFVRRWALQNVRAQKTDDVLIGLLRANTRENLPKLTKPGLMAANEAAAKRLAQLLSEAVATTGVPVRLLHMNAPWIGGDDRLFNREVLKAAAKRSKIMVERGYMPLDELFFLLSRAKSAVAMRYHGHVFCMALGIPFLSIDYTGELGKVHNLLQRIGYGDCSEEWGAIEPARANVRLQKLVADRDIRSAHLIQQSDKLVHQLNRTYEKLFEVDVTPI